MSDTEDKKAFTIINPEAPRTLKERLDKYCEGICMGLSRAKAYVAAGYSPNSADKNATVFHRTHQEYITAYIGEHIGTHAPMAIGTILKIMNDPDEKGGIRLKAAQDILDRAGYSAKQKLEVTTKDVKDMSTEDLQKSIQGILSEDPKLAKIFQFKQKA